MVAEAQYPSKKWYHANLTYPDTVRTHEERFIDQETSEQFWSVAIRIEADATNTSNIEFTFQPSGEQVSIAAGCSVVYEHKSAKAIYVKLATADDNLIVTAW